MTFRALVGGNIGKRRFEEDDLLDDLTAFEQRELLKAAMIEKVG